MNGVYIVRCKSLPQTALIRHVGAPQPAKSWNLYGFELIPQSSFS